MVAGRARAFRWPADPVCSNHSRTSLPGLPAQDRVPPHLVDLAVLRRVRDHAVPVILEDDRRAGPLGKLVDRGPAVPSTAWRGPSRRDRGPRNCVSQQQRRRRYGTTSIAVRMLGYIEHLYIDLAGGLIIVDGSGGTLQQCLEGCYVTGDTSQEVGPYAAASTMDTIRLDQLSHGISGRVGPGAGHGPARAGGLRRPGRLRQPGREQQAHEPQLRGRLPVGVRRAHGQHPVPGRLQPGRRLGHYVGARRAGRLVRLPGSGSGNRARWQLTLPTDPAPSSVPGARIYSFEQHVAFWFGMALCASRPSPSRYRLHTGLRQQHHRGPEDQRSHAGSAYLELQFYPPG